MIALGIDPSLTGTGIAYLEWDWPHDFTPCWQTLTVTPGKCDGTVWGELSRIRYITRQVVDSMDGSDVDVAVIEGPSMHSKGGKPDERAGLRWAIIEALSAHFIDVAVVSPGTRAVLAADDGNASKTDVLKRMRLIHPDLGDHNQADAAALALAGAKWMGMHVTYTQHQQNAWERITWP